jgi:predicted metal-dependent HD superfamily phosphohydrolase
MWNGQITKNSREKLKEEIKRIFVQRPLSEEHIEFILDSYSEPWRHYHNCDHILLALNLVRQLQPQVGAEYRHVIDIMIVYHDVIFKLGRDKGWNERESAVIAAKHLASTGYDSIFIDLVVSGTECTIHHTVPEELKNWAPYIEPLLDADLLAGFGTSWEEFSEKTRLIGLEYSPLYTAAEYQAGRAKFAKAFLAKPKIFHDPSLKENLQRTMVLFS